MDGPCTSYTTGYGRIRQFDGYLIQTGRNLTDILRPLEITSHTDDSRVLMTANTTLDYRRTISFNDSETMFLAYLILRAGDDFVKNQTAWEDARPNATECGLYFCVKGYSSKVERGSLVEKQGMSPRQSYEPFAHEFPRVPFSN